MRSVFKFKFFNIFSTFKLSNFFFKESTLRADYELIKRINKNKPIIPVIFDKNFTNLTLTNHNVDRQWLVEMITESNHHTSSREITINDAACKQWFNTLINRDWNGKRSALNQESCQQLLRDMDNDVCYKWFRELGQHLGDPMSMRTIESHHDSCKPCKKKIDLCFGHDCVAQIYRNFKILIYMAQTRQNHLIQQLTQPYDYMPYDNSRIIAQPYDEVRERRQHVKTKLTLQTHMEQMGEQGMRDEFKREQNEMNRINCINRELFRVMASYSFASIFLNKRELLCTKLPPNQERQQYEFWRMIWRHQIITLVSFGNEDHISLNKG